MWQVDEILSAIRTKLEKMIDSQEVLDSAMRYHEAVITGLRVTFEPKYPTASLRGLGGGGVVLRLSSGADDGINAIEVIEKCLKYPHTSIGLGTKISLSDSLQKEAQTLSDLHHRHIMPVEVCGSLSLKDKEGIQEQDFIVPYYTMPFVNSIDLAEFADSDSATAEKLTLLYAQAASALEYIHERGLLHIDIKPQNIFVQNYENEPNALLADFGFCKWLPPEVTSSVTMVITTDPYAHPDL